MQNKGAIQLFASLLVITCVFYLSFTWITRSIEKDAKEFAQSQSNGIIATTAAKKYANGNAGLEQQYKDSVYIAKEAYYLDSLRNQPVYDIFITQFTYDDCKSHEINLGLDLRGGMNVTLEISVPDIIKSLSNYNPDPVFNKAINEAQKKLGATNTDFVTLFGEEFKRLSPTGKLATHFQTIELKGKIQYSTSDEEVLKLIRNRVTESIETSEKTLRARIDKFGVSSPNIQRLEVSGRILVELPGVTDKQRVRKLLQSTANLEFWETYSNLEMYGKITDANTRLKEILAPADTNKTKAETADTTKAIASAPADTTIKKSDDTTVVDLSGVSSKNTDTSLKNLSAKDTSAKARAAENPLLSILQQNIYQAQDNQYAITPGAIIGYAHVKDTGKVNKYLNDKRVRAVFPQKIKFMWSVKPREKGSDVHELYAIKITTRDGKSRLYGDIIADARKDFDQQGGSGSPQISMTMKPEAAQIWKRLTAENKGKEVAVVLDNSVYTAPTVQGEIPNGQSQITGNFTIREADDLVTILKAGKMPAPCKIAEETVVGATLGEEAINAGLLSFIVALGVVLVYMGLYYNKAGWIADIALFANVFFIMGVLASLNAVLSLPGIAGIVLTIGMSVDANILIFERVREEMALGKGIGLAIKEGFRNAMSSIIDSNVTTLLLGIILFYFGTGPIQGFATTLIIGILSSLFCAIFITRLVFEFLLNRKKDISFYTALTKNAFKNINIDFVGKRKLYYLFSGLIIAVGIFFYFNDGGFKLGVDFTGGRTYVVRFENQQEQETVRTQLEKTFGTVVEVKTYGQGNQQKITTSYNISSTADNAEEEAEQKLKEGLDQLNTKYEIMQSQKVGETISRDIKTKALGAIFFSCLVMFMYIFIRFKKWQYGMGAVAALFHDVLIVLSVFVICDGFLPFSLEIDQHFIAAILTVMGYSMTDTVVVFDRIREYLADKKKADLDRGEEKHKIINYALNSTLSRTVNTSLTIFFVLFVIFIFGGETIKGFSFALLIGIVIGTYSSICIATPIVIDFDRKGKAVTG